MEIIIGALIGIALGYIIMGIIKIFLIGFNMIFQGITGILQTQTFLIKRNKHRVKCGLPKLTYKDLK